MGYTRYDSTAYSTYATATAHKTMHDYTNTSLLPEFDPKQIKLRESRISDINPSPTPIFITLDVSGSMGHLAEACRKGLGPLFEEILTRKPVTDPHVMAAVVDDMEVKQPGALQVTQFEADPVTIGKQIEKLWLCGNGGGNSHESYLAPLYFAATRVGADAFTQRRKGYLFTVGDEEPMLVLPKWCIADYFGDEVPTDLTAEQIIKMIESDWHYFHLMVAEGHHMRSYGARVKTDWAKLLGERAVLLTDHTKMAEVIISLIEVTNGRDKDDIVASWKNPGTSLVVHDAIKGMSAVVAGGVGRAPVRV